MQIRFFLILFQINLKIKELVVPLSITITCKIFRINLTFKFKVGFNIENAKQNVNDLNFVDFPSK